MQCGVARKCLYSLETPDSGAEALPASAEVAEARAHVAGCAACQEFFAAEQRLSAFLRARAPREKPSATLREQVLARIAEERKPTPGASRGFGPPHRAMVLSLAGVLIISALLVGLWRSQRHARVTPQQLIAILVDDHAVTFPSRAEIISSDREVVQTWFRGRVDFAIRLPRTADPQLIGGRLCDLKGRLAALVFYQHPQSRVSLFILDGSDLRLPEDQLVRIDSKRCLLDARKGYNVVLWQERGLLYSLVSDAHNAELLQLAEKF